MKKKYLAVYLGSPEKMEAWGEQNNIKDMEKEGIQAWGNWVDKNSKIIKDIGSPLGSTLKVDKNGVSETSNNLTAYTVVEASSHEEAAKLFRNHPHFTIFPGDSIEVMECLEIPGMEK